MYVIALCLFIPFAKAYSCALHRDFLIHGRLYVGESHLCFYANIFGWVTSVVIALGDIISVDKRNTALMFPNAILVCTLHHRYFFASFLFREQAFTRIVSAWKAVFKGQVETTGTLVRDDEKYDFFSADEISQTKDDQSVVESRESSALVVQKDSSLSCNCEYHFSILGLQLECEVGVDRLFEALKAGLQEVFHATVDRGAWEHNTSLSYNATVEMRFTFESQQPCHIQQSCAVCEEGKRYVIDLQCNFFEADQFNFKTFLRFCLVSLNERGSQVVGTFDVQQPDRLFFKESMKCSIILDFRALLSKFQGIVCRNLGDRRHEGLHSVQTTESYFDVSSFWQSLAWLVLMLLFIYILFTVPLRGTEYVLRRPKERNSCIRTVSVETNNFVSLCLLETRKELHLLKKLVDSMVKTMNNHVQERFDDGRVPTEGKLSSKTSLSV